MRNMHYFGSDALAAVCCEAMGKVLHPIDGELACVYLQEANWIAEWLGRCNPHSEMPAIFTLLSPEMEGRCSQGACDALSLRNAHHELDV
ncbi:hypothetical protein [Azohydromonas lata]|uniref:hypothetical protein n=1 Tax=Azohydromonas lata TaxID=45677 RepID=UPI0012F4C83B|nr:hypothetical protein [Azohydromonas lata]